MYIRGAILDACLIGIPRDVARKFKKIYLKES